TAECERIRIEAMTAQVFRPRRRQRVAPAEDGRPAVGVEQDPLVPEAEQALPHQLRFVAATEHDVLNVVLRVAEGLLPARCRCGGWPSESVLLRACAAQRLADFYVLIGDCG